MQRLDLALSKGPNRVCVSLPSSEDGNGPSPWAGLNDTEKWQILAQPVLGLNSFALYLFFLWLLAQIVLRPWIWRRYIAPKRLFRFERDCKAVIYNSLRTPISSFILVR
jgi:hypothetical protein